MKKFMLALSFLISSAMAAHAETFSTDKSGFAEISSAIDDAAYDIRYYSSNNFTGHKIDGYKAPPCLFNPRSLNRISKSR